MSKQHTILPELNSASMGNAEVPSSQSQKKVPLEAGEGDTSSVARSWKIHLWILSY